MNYAMPTTGQILLLTTLDARHISSRRAALFVQQQAARATWPGAQEMNAS